MTKLLKGYMKGAILFALLGPLCMAVEVIADISQPAFMKEIIDIGVTNGDVSYILGHGKIMLFAAFAGLIGGAGCCVFSTIAAARFGAKLRNGLFAHIQSLSYTEIDKLTTSSLITRLTNDVSQKHQLVMMVLRGMFRMPLLCIGGVIASFLLSPKMSLIFIIAIPILFAAVFFVIKQALPLATEVQKKLDRINTVTRENLLGVRVVKAFVGQAHEKERFEVANDNLMRWSLKQSYLTIILTPISTFVLNASVIALFWFGGNMSMKGTLETGTIMALLMYMTQVLSSFVQVVMLMINISRATASVRRINEVLDTEPSIRDPENPQTPQDSSVMFDNVSFRYNEESAEYVLKDIDFTIRSGETFGIIGATGSGKSSLVALIPRLYDTVQGAVKIGGVNVKNITRSEITRNVGMVLQESILFAGTIEENLRWSVGDDVPLSQIEKSAADAQALDFIRAKENGFGTYVEQRGGNFSGGQKQRLSIARTFAGNPKILILDDSTSAVDTETDAKIRAAIAKQAAEMTVIIIAQRISAIMGADRILVLDNGTISGIGTHSELLRSNEIYKAIAESQLGVTA
jgi:ATP-binding cassette subfamily B protein